VTGAIICGIVAFATVYRAVQTYIIAKDLTQHG